MRHDPIAPEDIEGLLRKADACHAAGQLPEVFRLAEKVLSVEPDNVRAALLRGVSAAGQGDVASAIRDFRRVIELDGGAFDARIWLAGVLQLDGKVDEATAIAREAAKLRPNVAAGHILLGRCLLRQGEPVEALRSFERALALEPPTPILYHLIGQAQVEAGLLPDAVLSFRYAIQAAPQVPDSYISLAQILMWRGERTEAVACLRRAHQLEPSSPRGLAQLAKAQIEEGSFGGAESTLRQAARSYPRAAAPPAVLGNLLWQSGRFDEATAALESTIALRPLSGQPYCDLVHCRTITERDRPLIDRMESAVGARYLPSEDRRFLHYALGKAYDDLGEYEAAIGHFDEANRLMLKIAHPPFDRAWYAREFGSIIERFSIERMSMGNEFGAASDLPILIVGMIRSGTTLTEQIVSSHPEVESGGELPFWTRMPESNALAYGRAPFDLKKIGELGAQCIEYLQALANGRPRITDKMPLNYAYLGLMYLALPHARMIHCRRNPLDNAVSMYTTAFHEPIGFLHSRENIVDYTQQYLRLMAHWRAVLPSDRFLEVDYEDLIQDREPMTRRIIEFLGLEWSDDCLHPEAKRRTVRTPSAWQVRQPVYRNSINRWRNYEPWLGEFRALAGSE